MFAVACRTLEKLPVGADFKLQKLFGNHYWEIIVGSTDHSSSA